MNIAHLLRHDEVRRALHPAGASQLTRRELLRRLTSLGIGLGAASTLISALGEGYPAFAQTGQFKGQRLVVTSYGGPWQQFMEDEHIPAFEALTGAKVELAIGLAKDWFAKMQAAGKNDPPYDVFVTNETYLAQLRLEGYFAPLPADKTPNLAFVPKALRQPKDVGVLGLVGALGITYRSDQVKDAPKSWLDLGKYGNKTTIFTIGNSGEPQHVLKMAQILTHNAKNYKPAVDWIAKNLCAARQVDFSGTEQTLLTQGETYVGLIDAPDWAFLKAKGLPVEWVLPTEGYCGMFEQDMNVTVGSKVKDLGYAFINYWLSPPVQQKWAEKFYWTPANSHVVISRELQKLIPVTQDQLTRIPRWDYIWLNTTGVRDKMTDMWDHEFKGHC
jgi:putative spermidine/putrescine transport system substrate-binding protein